MGVFIISPSDKGGRLYEPSSAMAPGPRTLGRPLGSVPRELAEQIKGWLSDAHGLLTRDR